jgi:hypothetical protein
VIASWTANTPRAQRTVEIFRALGIEDDVLAHGTEHALMGDTVFCTSLACDERSAGYAPLAPTRRAQLVSLPPPVWGCTRRLGLGQYHPRPLRSRCSDRLTTRVRGWSGSIDHRLIRRARDEWLP